MRTVLITGASDGIGRALADRYHRDGWTVIAHGRRPVGDIDPPLPDSVRYVRHDLANGVGGLLQAIPPHLDLAILNAGVGSIASPSSTSGRDIEQMVAVNTVAPLLLAHGLHPMLSSSAGRLVFVGSTAARGKHPDFAIYAATKATLSGTARALRQEWNGTVEVQIVHPGPTATGMHDKAGLGPTPMRRFFTRTDLVADAIIRSIERGRGVTRFSLGFTLRHACARSPR